MNINIFAGNICRHKKNKESTEMTAKDSHPTSSPGTFEPPKLI